MSKLTRLRTVLLASLLCSASMAARADTITVFTLAGNTSYGTLSGTVTLNATTGKFTDSAIKFLYTGATSLFVTSGTTYNFAGPGINSTSGIGYSSNDFAGTGPAALYDFDLMLPTASLIGYTGGSLCTTSSACGGRISAVELLATGSDLSQVTSGTLTAQAATTAVTPEPSALLLLGTGVVSVGVLARKRYV